MTTNSSVSIKACDAELGYLILRLTMGMNILMHGSMRLITGDDRFATGMAHTLQNSFLPQGFVHGFGIVLPWVEAAIGLLVLIGLFSRVALVAGGLLMTVLTFGVGTIQNWETAGLQLSYALVFGVLLAALAFNRYSLDGWRRRGKT